MVDEAQGLAAALSAVPLQVAGRWGKVAYGRQRNATRLLLTPSRRDRAGAVVERPA